MKTITASVYICELCGARYTSLDDAKMCESRPVTKGGVQVGDIVLITRGDGAGSHARVERVFVYGMNWGYAQAARYWHTVGLAVEVLDKIGGSRQLTFDDYQKV